jgi:hypothetical protein
LICVSARTAEHLALVERKVALEAQLSALQAIPSVGARALTRLAARSKP